MISSYATAGTGPQSSFRHDVFISYSRKDTAFAVALERALRAYKPPRSLKVPQRHLAVFRDESDMSGSDYERLSGNTSPTRKS